MNNIKCGLLLLCSLLCCLTLPAYSADIRYVPVSAIDTGHISDYPHVEIVGEITEGDPARLRKALAQVMSVRNTKRLMNPLVILDSPGGSVSIALEMGRILRNSLAITAVERDKSCSSSCVFLLVGGVDRFIFMNGKIGLHRPRFEAEIYGNLSKDEARAAYNTLVQRCVEYMKEMGISDSVFSDMLKVPSHKVRFVYQDYAEEHGLVGVDPGWEEWERARRIRRDGEPAVKALDRWKDCVSSGGADSACMERYLKELDGY